MKKHTAHADHTICFDNSDQLSSASLRLKISSKCTFIGNLSGFTLFSKHEMFSVPFMAIFTHLSEFRLHEGVLLNVCAMFRLETYDFIVLPFKFLLEADHVTNALAYSTVIGKLNLTLYSAQKFSYNFQADTCFFHVDSEDEYSTRFSKSWHKDDISTGSKSLLMREWTLLLDVLLNFHALLRGFSCP